MKSSDFLTLGKTAAVAAHDKKASDIHLIDMRRHSSVTDFFLILSVDSAPHLRAVLESIDRRIKQKWDIDPSHTEGKSSAHWMVMDYGGLVVHAMDRESRSFYDLERLWEGARRVAWNGKPDAMPKAKARKAKTAGRPRGRAVKKKKAAASKKK